MKASNFHFLIRLGLLLIAGSFTALAVAAFLCDRAYWLEVGGYRSVEAPVGTTANRPVSGVEVSYYQSPGLSLLRTYYLPEEAREEFRSRAALIQERLSDHYPRFDPPPILLSRVAPWLEHASFELKLQGVQKSGNVIGAGWPWHYLWCEHTQPLPMNGLVHDALMHGFVRWDKPGWVLLPSAAMHDEVLPLRPLGWRFIGASVLWSLPWIVIWIAASVLKQWCRMKQARRGICPNCGYPQLGLISGTCPECGVARLK